jgi:L-ascorbate metabolism protein UlaG (beta-lactamase superfamily)
VHMNPEDAILAYRDLVGGRGEALLDRPPLFVPIHWGTFKLTDEPMDEPPRRLTAAWSNAGLPSAVLSVLPHGGTRLFAR